MGCNEGIDYYPSLLFIYLFLQGKGLYNISHIRYRPRLDAATKPTTREVYYIYVPCELPFISDNSICISDPFTITAFLWMLCAITLVDTGHCSRMHLQIKPALDKGTCQQYED